MSKIQTSSIDTFINLFHSVQSNLIHLGEHTANAIKEDAEFPEKVCAAFPEITMEFIRKCELVGLKKLHPRLVIAEGPGARRLRFMPLALQEKYVTNPVPLVIKTNAGAEIINVDVMNLDSEQAKQVFDCAKQEVRSEGAQRAFLERVSSNKQIPKRINEPYRILGDKLIVLEPCTFTRKELAEFQVKMD